MVSHPKIQTAPDGSLLLGFGQYGGEVEVAAISGDGRWALTVTEVGVARIWDLDDGREVATIAPESPLAGTSGTAPFAGEFRVFIESAALDHDGAFALLGLNDGTAVIHRVSDGRLTALLHLPDAPPAARWQVIRAVAYSPDGALALVGLPGRRVGVWTADGARRVALLCAPLGDRLVGQPFVRDTLVSSVAVSPDARTVFAGCVDGTATAWDLPTGRVLLEATEHAEDTLAVFERGGIAGWATTAGSVWLSRAGGPARKILATGEPWAEVAFGEDGLLARSTDGAVTLHRFTGERESLLDGGRRGPLSHPALTLGFAPPDLFLFPEGEQCQVAWRGQARISLRREERIVTARFSPDAETVAVEGWSDWVDLFLTADGALLRRFGPAAGVGDFAFSPDGKLLAIGEIGHGGGLYARAVHVFDVESGARLFQLDGHDWQVSTVRFSPEGDALAAAGDGVIVWRIEGSAAEPFVHVEAERGAEMDYLAGGRLLVLDDGRAQVISGDRVERTFPVPFRYGVLWAVSPEGDVLGLSVRQGVARYDLSTGKPLGRIEAALARPEQLPPPDLAQAIEPRSGAALWRTEGGPFLHQSDGPRGWVQPLTLSPDRRVVIPSQEGAAIVDVSGAPRLVGMVPFHGKMRAGRVVGDQVVLVNEEGRFFRSSLPGR